MEMRQQENKETTTTTTTIRVSYETKAKLDRKKIHHRESYDELLARIVVVG
jgi:hypothetical protein